MQFLYPSFLWALAALSIPIAVHLFNFRRYKTVYFSNVSFLKEVQEETTSASRLKHLLVLAARCLALLFLVLAFAQPFIPRKNTNLATGKKYVSIYLDNSFSMGTMSGGVRLLDKARQAAKEIAANFSPDDQFQLLTNDFSGHQQRLISREELLKLIEEIELSPASRSLNEVVKRQRDVLTKENGNNQIAYLLSDFQVSAGGFTPDSNIRYNLIPLQADAPSNIYIDSAWFYEPVQLLNQSNQLLVRIKSSGEKGTSDSRLLLKINGQTKAIADFSLEGNNSRMDTLKFTLTQPGWNKMELSIQDYPVTNDDSYYGTFYVSSQLNVLAITENGRNTYLDALFGKQPEINYQDASVGNLNYSAIKGKQLVVLANIRQYSSGLTAAISDLLKDGGAAVCFPDPNGDLNSYNQFLTAIGAATMSPAVVTSKSLLRDLNLKDRLFHDVFERMNGQMTMPKVNRLFPFKTNTPNEQPLLVLQSGESILSRYPSQQGLFYVSAVSLDPTFSELPVHALFAPMLYKMAVLQAGGGAFANVIGDRQGVEIKNRMMEADRVYKVSGNAIEFIPQQTSIGNKVILGMGDQLKKAGIYAVQSDKSDSADYIAMNYSRTESHLRFFSIEQLRGQLPQLNVNIINNGGKEVVQAIAEADRGTTLWKLMLILTLLFLGVEAGLIRFFKQSTDVRN
ncbi:MAG: BatA domain-containing protein [Chitinophagales bacterium]